MNKPEITIVIPVYNRELLILETLESLKIQTFLNWECIIVDDYSSDETIKNIMCFIKSDERYKLIEKVKEQKGAPCSRNIGWRMASSNYVIFLDSDDLLAPWALENRLEAFRCFPNFDFLLFPAMEFDKHSLKSNQYRSLINSNDFLKDFLSFESVWQTSCPIWKINFLEGINGWDEEALSWQDGEVHIRALLKGAKCKWISDVPDVFIRLDTKEKITKDASLNKYINNIFIFNKIYNHISKEDLKSFFSSKIEIWIYNLIEKLNENDSYELLRHLKKIDNTPNLVKLKNYNLMYQKTKNIKGIKRLVFSIRKYNSYFTKRTIFFSKHKINKDIEILLKDKLSNIGLYEKNLNLFLK